MKNPKYSIIVPAYNEEKTIVNSLKSLKAQDLRNFEIIVVDNNSTDNTAKKAAKLVPRIYKESRQGYIHAVNKGVRVSRGKYVAVADADSFYPAGWLKQVDKWFTQDGNLVGVYGLCNFYDSGALFRKLSRVAYALFTHLSILAGLHNTPGFNFVMSKAAYKASGGYDSKIFNRMGLDLELGKRISRIGPLRFDSSLIVETSARRFRKNGVLATTISMLFTWINVYFNRKNTITYEAYNEIRR